jgi:tetratricopeptide (TPR) repeat protein
MEGKTMNWGRIMLCCWPGLPGLWQRGQTFSLVIAIGFTILLNAAIICTYIWPRALGESFPIITWPMILLIWSSSIAFAYKSMPNWLETAKIAAADESKQSDILFIRAQTEYLKGNWDETERLLRRCLGIWPRDIEARLLLATLLRHSRRLFDASEELAHLLKYDESTNWISEIRREQKLIEIIAADPEE